MKTQRSNTLSMTLSLMAMLSLSLAPAVQAAEIGAISFSELTEEDLGGTDIIVYPNTGGAGAFDAGGGPDSFTHRLRVASAQQATAALLSRAAQLDHGGGSPLASFMAQALTADAAALSDALSARLAALARKFDADSKVPSCPDDALCAPPPDRVFAKVFDVSQKEAQRLLSAWSAAVGSSLAVIDPAMAAAFTAGQGSILTGIADDIAGSIRDELEDAFSVPRPPGPEGAFDGSQT